MFVRFRRNSHSQTRKEKEKEKGKEKEKERKESVRSRNTRAHRRKLWLGKKERKSLLAHVIIQGCVCARKHMGICYVCSLTQYSRSHTWVWRSVCLAVLEYGLAPTSPAAPQVTSIQKGNIWEYISKRGSKKWTFWKSIL